LILKIVDLKDSVEVEIKKGKEEILSREHAFLIEIPNKEVHFLEADEKHQWHSLKELSDVLTYSNQKQFLDLCQICDKPL